MASVSRPTAAPTKRRRRPDGRPTGGSLRALAAEVSTLSRADGSAQLSSGATQILAAVHGPSAPRNPSRERSDGAVISVVFRHTAASSTSFAGTSSLGASVGATSPAYGASQREVERFLANALSATVRTEAYPRTVIEVVVQVIKADGSAVGVALNAAVLALLDAGVEMTGLPIATTCLVVPKDGSHGEDGDGYELHLDPCAEEEAGSQGAAVVLVIDSSSADGDGILASMSFGTLSLEAFLACMEGAARANKAVLAFLRLAIEQKVTREAQTLWSS